MLHRIRALKDFGIVKIGDLGGWVESERNLSQDGICWIYDNASVYGRARVCDSAIVCEYAIVEGNARVYGSARVYGNARVCDSAIVYGTARVCGVAIICNDAKVCRSEDYIVVQGFGRVQRTTTFYRLKNGDIGVTCGCFDGTIREFRDEVKETHGGNKYAQEYLMVADLMELHFGKG